MTQRIKVDNFYGGINNITSPHLLTPSQSVRLENISIISGSLDRVNYHIEKELVSSSANVKHYNDGEIIDLGTNEKYKGVKVVKFQDYSYILHEGIPKQMRGSSLISTIVSNTGLSGCSLSAGDEDLTNVSNDDIYEYTYYVTYKNAAGFESPLQLIGETNNSVTLLTDKSGLVQSSSKISFIHNAGHKINVYRTGNKITTPSLVFTIDENNLITNTLGTTSNINNEVTFSILDKYITLVNANPATSNPPSELENLTASKDGMAASKDNILYLSLLRADAWDTFSSLELSSKITGLTYTTRGIIAFTASNHMYYITGTSANNISVSVINEDIGCSSHKSIVKMRNGSIAWIYGRDVYIFDGGSVSSLTRGRYKVSIVVKGEEQTNSITIDNKYIMGTENGISIIDFDIPGYPIIDYTLIDVNNSNYSLAGNLQSYTLDNKTYIGYYKEDNSFNRIAVKKTETIYLLYDIGNYSAVSITDLSSESIFGEFSAEVIDYTSEFGNIGCYGSTYCSEITETVNEDKGIYKSPDFVGSTVDADIVLHTIDIVHIGKVIVYLFLDGSNIKTETIDREKKGVTRVNYPSGTNKGLYTSIQLETEETVFSYSISYEATPIP